MTCTAQLQIMLRVLYECYYSMEWTTGLEVFAHSMVGFTKSCYWEVLWETAAPY